MRSSCRLPIVSGWKPLRRAPPVREPMARGDRVGRPIQRERCACFDQYRTHPRARVGFHGERQDTTPAGWLRLLALVEEAAADGREEFDPLVELSPQERRDVITLPASIGRLSAVKHLRLYGSNLVRIPPKIGATTALEEFSPYTGCGRRTRPRSVATSPRWTRSGGARQASAPAASVTGRWRDRSCTDGGSRSWSPPTSCRSPSTPARPPASARCRPAPPGTLPGPTRADGTWPSRRPTGPDDPHPHSQAARGSAGPCCPVRAGFRARGSSPARLPGDSPGIRRSRRCDRFCTCGSQWGGWDSNPRPTDYESAALTG